MQRAAVHGESRKREACREYAPGQFIDRLRSRRDLQRRTEEPIGNCLDRVTERAVGRRALDDLGRMDVRLYYAARRQLGCRFRHLSANRLADHSRTATGLV